MQVEVEDQGIFDVYDNLYEIYVIGSNEFDPNTLIRCDLQNDDSLEKCDCLDFQKGGLDMKVEQIKDDNISNIWSMIFSGEEGKDVHKHYLLVDEFVYYFSNVDDDPCIRLLVPRHIKAYVVSNIMNRMVI